MVDNMEWFNVFGLIFIAVIMIPNVVFAIKCKDGFDNKWNNKYVEVTEQVGRLGCFGFMIINIPGTWFGWWSDEAFALYLIVDTILVMLYCAIWIICFKKNSVFRALALSIIPSMLFLFSGIMSRSVLLITKFLFVICTAVLSILFGGPVYIAVISAVYIILSLFAHVFKGFFKSYFKLFVFFGLMLILISSLFQNAEAEVLLSIGKISLYKVGFIRGCRMSSVILTLAGGLLLFTATTQVQDLMAVLGKMGLSSNVVYMVVASFRSINELSDKMGQILEAQSSRGIETEGNLFVRLKAILPMLITLLLSSMVSAEEKAIALEARCFNCHCKRTSLRVNNTSRADVVTMIGIAFVTAALIAVKFIFIK